jgi:outer membrane protein assembly factor BamB
VVDAATGKAVLKQQDKSFMFSSPSIAGDVVFIGVLNGTLQARDLKTGDVLWSFETETSKQNQGWVLAKDRSVNLPMLYHSNWREGPIVAADREFAIGAIFSSPLIVNGVVYFGSVDGYLYALE